MSPAAVSMASLRRCGEQKSRNFSPSPASSTAEPSAHGSPLAWSVRAVNSRPPTVMVMEVGMSSAWPCSRRSLPSIAFASG